MTSNTKVKVVFHVAPEWIFNAAWCVKSNPSRRLSKRAVLEQLTDWYEAYGLQLEAGDVEEAGGETKELSEGEWNRLAEWVLRNFPDAEIP